MKAKHFNQNLTDENISEISSALLCSKIIIFPTETVYGIGANAKDLKACKKIFNIKKRDKGKALIVLISNLKMLDDIVEKTNEIEKKLIKKFWPGPLTIIFNKNNTSKISNIVIGNQNTIGIRMTSSSIATRIIDCSGVPIVAPSANISGKPTGTKIKNIIKDLGDKVDYIIDIGDINDNTTSTIVQVIDNEINILREGKISKEELSKIAKIKE